MLRITPSLLLLPGLLSCLRVTRVLAFTPQDIQFIGGFIGALIDEYDTPSTRHTHLVVDQPRPSGPYGRRQRQRQVPATIDTGLLEIERTTSNLEGASVPAHPPIATGEQWTAYPPHSHTAHHTSYPLHQPMNHYYGHSPGRPVGYWSPSNAHYGDQLGGGGYRGGHYSTSGGPPPLRYGGYYPHDHGYYPNDGVSRPPVRRPVAPNFPTGHSYPPPRGHIASYSPPTTTGTIGSTNRPLDLLDPIPSTAMYGVTGNMNHVRTTHSPSTNDSDDPFRDIWDAAHLHTVGHTNFGDGDDHNHDHDHNGGGHGNHDHDHHH